jgi:hypothetical protein
MLSGNKRTMNGFGLVGRKLALTGPRNLKHRLCGKLLTA